MRTYQIDQDDRVVSTIELEPDVSWVMQGPVPIRKCLPDRPDRHRSSVSAPQARISMRKLGTKRRSGLSVLVVCVTPVIRVQRNTRRVFPTVSMTLVPK